MAAATRRTLVKVKSSAMTPRQPVGTEFDFIHASDPKPKLANGNSKIDMEVASFDFGVSSFLPYLKTYPGNLKQQV